MWARTDVETSFTTGAPFTPHQADLMTDFNTRYGADLVGFTVVRIRGLITVDSAAAAGDRIPVVVGIRSGSEGEVPSTEFNPMTNGQYLDWMAYEPFLSFFTNLPVNQNDVGGRLIDIKSARKLDELDQTLFLYAGSDTALTQTVNLTYNLSVLLMQP